MKYFILISALIFSSCNGTSILEKNNKRYTLEVNTREVILQLAAENSKNEYFQKILSKTDSLKKMQREKGAKR